jgi:alpha-ketoglutarate-dependent taurine dioxygenase
MRCFLTLLVFFTTNLIGNPPLLDAPLSGYFINEQSFPYVISPKTDDLTLSEFQEWAISHQDELKDLLTSQGAVLLRGFPIHQPEDFANVVRAVIGKELIDYKGEGSRNRIIQGVYTSTEAPPDFKIPLHNELTCTLNPVSYICFYCNIAPNPGTGQTLIGRTDDVTLEIMKRPHIWDLFASQNLNYISRHPPEGNFFSKVNRTHRTWQQAFETEDKTEVERICRESGFDFKWMDEWIEVVRHVPGISSPNEHFEHPCWFNQAHLYDANPRLYGGWLKYVLANLLYISSSTKPYDIEFEDGSPISRATFYEIYDILDAHTIRFDWQEGDVLLLDNHKALHGKAPSSGQRRILVSMIR